MGESASWSSRLRRKKRLGRMGISLGLLSECAGVFGTTPAASLPHASSMMSSSCWFSNDKLCWIGSVSTASNWSCSNFIVAVSFMVRCSMGPTKNSKRILCSSWIVSLAFSVWSTDILWMTSSNISSIMVRWVSRNQNVLPSNHLSFIFSELGRSNNFLAPDFFSFKRRSREQIVWTKWHPLLNSSSDSLTKPWMLHSFAWIEKAAQRTAAISSLEHVRHWQSIECCGKMPSDTFS